MHFPDTVLSPSTSFTVGIAMLPVWVTAGRRVRESLGTRQVPLLALGAAFCFTVMLFNLPAFGGTTAHPVAGTLIAILLGPWAAVIGISAALAIQALFFGDGGLLAYGANCFAMAFVLPFVGYSIYSLLASHLPEKTTARPLYAAIGAFLGLNAAAAIVAVLLGIQPALFHEPNGHALFFPFGLKVTLPAMLGTHLLIAGPAEAIVTGLVVTYAQWASLPLYGVTSNGEQTRTQPRNERLWIGLLALIALSPLGLLAKGEAWGEWDAKGMSAQIAQHEGQAYIPKGVERAEEGSHKGVRGLEDYASDRGAKGYITAGLAGTGALAVLLMVGGRLLVHREILPATGDNEDAFVPREETETGDTLPDWLRRPAEEVVRRIENSTRPSNPFLERTLAELAQGAAITLNGERWARQKGFLQGLDPRAKAIVLLGMILVTAFLHNPLPLLTLYLLTVAMGGASGLSIKVLIRRVWLTVPLFAGAIALPAALNIVTPGRALLVLWREPYLTLTAPGLSLAAVLLLRVAVAVSCATLLTLTTRWNDLLRALRTLFVPRLFVAVLAMTYRYLTVLMQSAAEMFIARRSRTVGRATNADGRRFVGAAVGALFGKTVVLSEEVHAAMLSRGYTGEARTLTRLQWSAADTLWTLAILAITIIATYIRG